MVDNTEVSDITPGRPMESNSCGINGLEGVLPNNSTACQHRLWKTAGSTFLPSFLVLLGLSILLASGCTAKAAKKEVVSVNSQRSAADDGLYGLGKEEVRKKLGDPTKVSRLPDGHTLWTYTPSWKLTPSNAGTVYVEFEGDKVIKVTRTR